jgi:hypothetical protein
MYATYLISYRTERVLICVHVIDLKLGLLGVTIVYASGDYGVAGNGGVCLDGGVRVSTPFSRS